MGNAETGTIRRRRGAGETARTRFEERAARIKELLPLAVDNLARGDFPQSLPDLGTTRVIAWQGDEAVAWQLKDSSCLDGRIVPGVCLLFDGTLVRQYYDWTPSVRASIEDIALPEAIARLELIASFRGVPPPKSWRVL